MALRCETIVAARPNGALGPVEYYVEKHVCWIDDPGECVVG